MAKKGKPIVINTSKPKKSTKKETEVKVVGPTYRKLQDNRTPKAVMDYRENVKKRGK